MHKQLFCVLLSKAKAKDRAFIFDWKIFLIKQNPELHQNPLIVYTKLSTGWSNSSLVRMALNIDTY